FIKYAGAAYCSKEKLMNWSCTNCNGFASGAGEVTYFTDAGTKTAGYLAINKGQKSIIISFRGSQNIANWIGNINILFTNANLPSPFQNADIHSGFNKMTNVLLPSVESALKSAISKYPSYKVIFTGHSLGGAIATLTAYRLAQKNVIGWDRVNLITYGQPRVGDPDFASFLNTKPMYSTRVTSYADLVAISPGKFLGYGH
ncbi:alpha/beta-hydrolase, partial [Conidiobolus coronatus NRRL 28638]